MIHLKINDQLVEAEEGQTILDVATNNNILIPTLCHFKNLHAIGSCRICSVEVVGARNLMAACVTPVVEGMVVQTHTSKVRQMRKILYELMLSDHPSDCLQCDRNGTCEFQELGKVLQVNQSRFEGIRSKKAVDDSSPAIVRDTTKCILCRRCVSMCNDVQGVCALNAQNRGFATEIGPGGQMRLGTAVCTYCGQCTTVCPVDALHEKDAIPTVWQALSDPARKTVVQTAPAVRAALGEEFGLEPGTLVTGKMVSALHQLGFQTVFDTNFTADLTILEEGYELLSRLAALAKKRGKVDDPQLAALHLSNHLPDPVLPMVTSCSPGWIKYAEHFFGDLLAHLSTCKSPHMMLGALTKTWYASNHGLDPSDLFVVSIMPCTAKKYEIIRPELKTGGMTTVDAVLTTRELARMIREAGIDLIHLPDSRFDSPLGESTGAAAIFGTTGGVMEAALRTVYEVVTGRELPFDNLHVEPIAGFERIKTATIRFENVLPAWSFLEGMEAPIAVTSGLSGASQLMDEIRAGTSPYVFIEIMGCPGGCLSGGGQPRPTTPEIRQLRQKALYREDEGKPLRKSHENPDIQRLYQGFLGQPGSELSHQLLHTTYQRRNKI